MSHRTDSVICRDDQRVRRVDCRHCAVRHMMMFSVLEAGDFDHVLRPIVNTVFRKGEAIYRQGEAGGQVVSVRRGLIKVVQLLPDGEQRIVRLLGPGAALGLEALLDLPYAQTAMALADVDACLIPAPSLLELDRHNSALHQRLMGYWNAHLEQADRVITELNTGPLRARVARLVLLLGEIGAAEQGAPSIITTEDIASLVSSTQESASRVMADFRRRGLVERLPGGKFRYDDRALRAEISQTG